MSHSRSSITTHALLLALTLAASIEASRFDYTGITGSYCGQHFRYVKCCEGRQDDCSVPILGTLCYCDDFCENHDRSDCCPDYWSFCKAEEEEDAPEPILRGVCEHDGKKIYHGETFKKNCNVCKCSSIDNLTEILCEENRCLMEEEVIDRVNVEKLGWIARNYSQFYGRTLEDGLKHKLGTKDPSLQTTKMYPVHRAHNPDSIPRHFDSRITWSQYLTPIHDQGWCGASWAVSTVDVASDRFAIMSKGSERGRLSAQNLLSCDFKGQFGCEGGHLDKAWHFMKRYGIVDEACYPWAGRVEKCRVSRRGKLSDAGCAQRNSVVLKNEMFKVGPPYRLGKETDIMHEIINSGPVQATMRVYQDFFNYESGIYKHSRVSEHFPSDYHSVRIVGWGEEYSPITGGTVKYWQVANSWGGEWGEDGYFKIVRGSNECEIESFVVGIWAKTV